MAFRNGKASCSLCDTGGGGTPPGGGPSPLDRRIVYATVTSQIPADTNVSGPSGDNNLDADLGSLAGASFVTAYDILLNGARQVAVFGPGSGDVYPGTSLINGQLKFSKKLKVGDIITLIDWDE